METCFLVTRSLVFTAVLYRSGTFRKILYLLESRLCPCCIRRLSAPPLTLCANTTGILRNVPVFSSLFHLALGDSFRYARRGTAYQARGHVHGAISANSPSGESTIFNLSIPFGWMEAWSKGLYLSYTPTTDRSHQMQV